MPSHCRMRAFDRDLIRGGHYGQRSCEPHLKAEHMAAPTNAANVKKVSCQLGAVHTWHLADIPRRLLFCPLLGQSGLRVSTWCRQIFKLAALWERDHNYFSARSSDLIFPELRTVTDTRRPAFRVADARCGPGGRGPGARSMGHWPQRANVWRTVTSLGRDKTTKKRSARNRTAEATQ